MVVLFVKKTFNSDVSCNFFGFWREVVEGNNNFPHKIWFAQKM